MNKVEQSVEEWNKKCWEGGENEKKNEKKKKKGKLRPKLFDL